MTTGNVTIFEAVNETLSELYVGATSLSVHALIETNAARPPAEIAHWKPEHEVTYRSLEFGLDAQSSRAFVARYAEAMKRAGRRLIVAP